MSQILYNLRKTSDGFMLAKFGPDFNVEAVYHLKPQAGGYTCDCPAGGRPSCKHRKMIARMIPKADTDSFYCYETQSWHKPLAPQGEEPMQDKLDAFYATVEEVASEVSVEPTVFDLPQHEGVPVREVESLPAPTEPPTLRRRV